MDIKPGFYVGHWEGKETVKLFIIVTGSEDFPFNYDIDVVEPFGNDTMLIKDVKLHKKPIVFIERLTQFDKEG